MVGSVVAGSVAVVWGMLPRPVMVKFNLDHRASLAIRAFGERVVVRFPLPPVLACSGALWDGQIRIRGSRFARTSTILRKSLPARQELPGAAGLPFVTAASASLFRRCGSSSTTRELKRPPKGHNHP